MEYIKVTDALRCLSDALDNRKEYLGNFLDQYGLFNLTVYVSKDDGKSLEKDAVETKLLHDWIRTRYPVQSLMQTKFVSPYYLPKVQQAIINAMHSDEFSTEYQYYWEKDKFYSNRIFDLINSKPEIVGYQFGMNTDEITAITIQNLNSQIKNQADEIATLQARITKLESELNQANTTPAFDALLDTGHEYHAPDLAYAVRLWLDIYANGKPKDDSHTNLANVWISKHTNYNTHDDGYQMMQNRIREIATPLKDFGKKRIKESKK